MGWTPILAELGTQQHSRCPALAFQVVTATNGIDSQDIVADMRQTGGGCDGELGRQAMDRILAEMDKVGYRDSSLGLPGNLIPIRRADHFDLDPRWGGPAKEDGSDGFETYENGRATACFAYFTVAALYKLGEKEHGDRMLLPMLEAFARQGFSGRAADGNTYDWKDWQGATHGYEGFLVDNYYALLAVLDRAEMMETIP